MNVIHKILNWNQFLQEGILGDTIDRKIEQKIDTPVVSNIVKQSVRDASAKVLRDIRRGTLKGRFTKKDKENPIKTALKKYGIKAINKMPTSLRHKTARKVRDKLVDILEKE